jgi:hypothetical protein
MTRSIKRVWVAAIGAALTTMVAAALLFRLPRPDRPTPVPRAPSLRLGATSGTGFDPLFSEETALRDPTPLFLPTKWNSAQKEVVRHETESVFPPYDAKLIFNPDRLRLELPPSIMVPAHPAEALENNPPGDPFLGIGRAQSSVAALAPRGAFVAIVGVGNGRRVFSQALAGLPPGITDAPPAGGAWEFMATIDSAGLVGPLVQTLRSGTAADGYFLKYLTETLRVGQLLSPGLYRISIGP